MKKITFVVATNNADKLSEIRDILKSVGCDCVSLKEAGIDIDVEETGATIQENSYIKAKAVFDLCGRPVIADDTGLFVDALDGEPGVKTARYAGDDHDFNKGVDKLLQNLSGVKKHADRAAHFASTATAILEDGSVLSATGEVDGYIGTERRGNAGFGYDPVFWLYNNVSLAEISAERKNQISHRGRSIRKLAFLLRRIKKVRG
ncbi:MAG: RdgB/HAM1 family non-canonical purine NTP pyrophosphatase [Ruminococcaceae bacterium]|jgi:XTP/dITP diphosphohydrolase|nr:RdgB/HAM1 family non-canonical purine NTP pyrophosphatase [Oscillospiraceae bacterium]